MKVSDECCNLSSEKQKMVEIRLMAEANNVKYKTAHDWLRKGGVPQKERGILFYRNCQLTLLREDTGITVLQQTISKSLEVLLQIKI